MIVSMAYMDPGNYGTDIQAGAAFNYGLLWAVWMANLMAMLLQYISGKLGIATGKDLPELVRESLRGSKFDIYLNWIGAEAAAAATDLGISRDGHRVEHTFRCAPPLRVAIRSG